MVKVFIQEEGDAFDQLAAKLNAISENGYKKKFTLGETVQLIMEKF